MGLDLVEFVTEVEKVFRIDVADDEWPALRTLGEVHSAVRLRIPHFAGGACASLAGGVAPALPLRSVPIPTVRALVQSVVENNYGSLLWAGATWREAESFRVLRGIAAQQFGVPLEDLRPETLLVELAPSG